MCALGSMNETERGLTETGGNCSALAARGMPSVPLSAVRVPGMLRKESSPNSRAELWRAPPGSGAHLHTGAPPLSGQRVKM